MHVHRAFPMKRKTSDEVTNGARSHTLSRRRSTRSPHFDYHAGRLLSFLSWTETSQGAYPGVRIALATGSA